MDEKSLCAPIFNLAKSRQIKFLTLNENAGSDTVTVGIAGKPVRPAGNPVLLTIANIANGVILILVSSCH